MNHLLDLLHVTASGLWFLLGTQFVVSITKVIGRQHRKEVARTPFDLGMWARDWVNWATIAVNLVSAVLLLGIRESLAPVFGLSIEDADAFEKFFAVIVGTTGHLLWARVLTITAAYTNGNPEPTSTN